MTDEQLIEFGDAWVKLGSVVREQVSHVVNGTDNEDNVGHSGIRYARQMLEGHSARPVIDALDQWLEDNPEEDEE